MAPAATAEIRKSRIARVYDAMRAAGANCLILGAGVNTSYLWGYGEDSYERFCAAFLSPDADPVFVVPHLSAQAATAVLASRCQILSWDDSVGPEDAIQEALRLMGVTPGCHVALDDALKVSWMLEIDRKLPSDVVYQPAASIMGTVRAIKEPEERRLMIDAGSHTWQCWLEHLGRLHGISESETASVLSSALRERGASDTFAIVAAGEHTAYPHHQSGHDLIGNGLLLCDFGGCFSGYWSDVTVTVSLGLPDAHQERVYCAVWQAWREAVTAVRPGVRCSDIDRAAWSVLQRYGMEHHVAHRTGHGIGLEVHEYPWISRGSDTVLEEGMTFSIEPGVYIAGAFGVRLETVVMVESDGCRLLTPAPSERLPIIHVAEER